MFKVFYNLSIILYYLVVLLVSPFNKKAKLWIKGRKKILSKILASDVNNYKNIWIHVSSLGEFEQARPLIEKIKEKYKEYKIVLTFFSPSGYEIRKNYKLADYVWYLPVDLKSKAIFFINHIKPEKVFFIKYDFWYNYLEILFNKKIPTYLVSGIFRESQVFFKKTGKRYSKVLSFFTHLYVQNSKSADLLKSIGINNFTVAGDTRFDRVISIAENSNEITIVKEFVDSKKCMIAGSTWPEDEIILKNFINYSDNLKFIIAPHEITENHISDLIKGINKRIVKYSESEAKNLKEFDVLIIDNIGMLSTIYKYGKIAYIGGGFGAGIHNIVEPAVYGMPVIFGPKYKKFNEAVEMLNLKCAFSINNYEELTPILNKFLIDEEYLAQTSALSKDYVYKNKGATNIIIESVF